MLFANVKSRFGGSKGGPAGGARRGGPPGVSKASGRGRSFSVVLKGLFGETPGPYIQHPFVHDQLQIEPLWTIPQPFRRNSIWPGLEWLLVVLIHRGRILTEGSASLGYFALGSSGRWESA